MRGMLADVVGMARCDMLVGTASSAIAWVAYELIIARVGHYVPFISLDLPLMSPRALGMLNLTVSGMLSESAGAKVGGCAADGTEGSEEAPNCFMSHLRRHGLTRQVLESSLEANEQARMVSEEQVEQREREIAAETAET